MAQKKLPSKNQWKRFFKVLTQKEKAVFLIILAIALLSGAASAGYFYFDHTISEPAKGGVYREGIIGQPRLMNPLYLSDQDADRDVVEIIFSGLFKYNEQGEIVSDLAQDYQIKEDGKIYEITLKDNLFWHDGKKITADDVIFTINLIQEPQSQSSLTIKWIGILAEKASNQTVRFRLSKPYSAFLENLTVKILPKHIFELIPPQELIWKLISQQYLVGSGPFKLKTSSQDKNGQINQMIFERNEDYYGQKALLKKIVLNFYPDINNLFKAVAVGDIDGFALGDPKYFKNVSSGFNFHLVESPRYFALFFNLQAQNILSDIKLREALAWGVDKEKILQDVFISKGQIVNSPLLPDFFGLANTQEAVGFSPEKAGALLDELGFKLNSITGQREKVNDLTPAFSFTKNLTKGNTGKDVTELQKCLAKDPSVYPEAIINGSFGDKTKLAVIRFQEKYKAEVLTPAGLTKGNGEVKPLTRQKLNEVCFVKSSEVIPLAVSITIYDKFPFDEIARIVQENWQGLGIEVNINKISIGDFQNNVLAKKDYEITLFGEALGMIADPFPFWHSSAIDWPIGLNITGYQSKEADKLLESSRQEIDQTKRNTELSQLSDIITNDWPAIFLARPDYVYVLSNKIKGFGMAKITEPAKRFSEIEQWYMKTHRAWK